MKNIKKSLAMILIVTLISSCFVGCGGKDNKKGGSTNIEIAYWNSGLRTDWLEAMIKAFEEKYPEYNVTYNAASSMDAVMAGFVNKDSNTVDLYLAGTEYDTDLMEPLDDVLDSKVEGESKTIREKLQPSYLALEQYPNGKTYTLTYGGGVVSLVYNKKLFKEAGVNVLPRTTDELATTCDTLKSADIVPLCHYKSTDLWDYLAEVWYAQYEGMDYYMNHFYGCTDDNGTSPSKEVFTKKDGRFKALQACEKFITPDYVMSGSNTYDHISVQTMFLQGEAAIMPTGAWLENEMSSTGSTEDFGVMKVPVLSTITEKLSTVTTESALRKVISAVDAVTDGEKDITEYQNGADYSVDGLSVSVADWEYIHKARNTIVHNFAGETMFIPSYSDAKEGAKEFIKFIYSDEGYRIYTDELKMGLPTTLDNGEIDTTEWSSFAQEMYSLLQNSEQHASQYNKGAHPIFYEGGAALYAWVSFYDKFCSNNVGDRMNASEMWEEMLKTVDNYYENNWLANIEE